MKDLEFCCASDFSDRDAPSDERLAKVGVGDYVKVALRGEPDEIFWLRVTEIHQGRFIGVVANELIFFELAPGTTLNVEDRHVLDILCKES